ncbi:MAG: deoxyribonuclease V [Gammaproteobacteria bacterium]|nr:deoxyribonuclease V [Gammaproteobacteria bacterium]
MLHDWDVTPKRAVAIQRELRDRVITRDGFGELKRVAGVDVGFEDNGRVTRAAVVVLRLPRLEPVEDALARQPTRFPYVPGLLSFREVPAVLEALAHLSQPPDMLLCDGQGFAHPRRFGFACHLGLWTDLPSIGVAKTRLIGEHGDVPQERGQWCPLTHEDEVIGAVLRTRQGVKPVYVSIGHRISLQSAVDVVMRCTPRYRLPETTRQADRLASGRS